MPRRRREVPAGTEQFALIPTERIQPVLAHVNPNNVRIPETTVPRGLRDNIEALGILQPVAVIETNRAGYYGIAAGRRRVQAARDLDLPMIPALMFPVGTPRHVAAAIAVSENNQRSANPLTDFRAIEAMIAAGSSEQEIADTLFIPINTLRSRMRLAALAPPLREALERGEIAMAVAERIARLDNPRQALLLHTLNGRAEQGLRPRLTAGDVRTVTEARHQEQVQMLPDDVFAEVGVARDQHQLLTDQNVFMTLHAPAAEDMQPVLSLIQQGHTYYFSAAPIEFVGWSEDGLRGLTGLAAIEHARDAGVRPRRGRPPRAAVETRFTLADAVTHGWNGMESLIDAAIDAHPGDPDGGSEQILELLQGVRELIHRRVVGEAANAG